MVGLDHECAAAALVMQSNLIDSARCAEGPLDALLGIDLEDAVQMWQSQGSDEGGGTDDLFIESADAGTSLKERRVLIGGQVDGFDVQCE